MTMFIDHTGANQQIQVAVTDYKEAANAGMSLQQFYNTKYATDPSKYGAAFDQILLSENIVVSPNKQFGLRSTRMKEMYEGTVPMAATNVKDQVPTSRILFPAVIMGAIENKLVADASMTANAFDALVGYEDSINGDRWEQPILNYSRPEAARSQRTSQLAKPPSMLTITTSDTSNRIPTNSLGLEISYEAMAVMTLDYVAMSLARQASVERNERAINYILGLLNGDLDNGEGSLASLGLSAATNSFDAAATGGVITQKSWVKWLYQKSTTRTLGYVITDIDTALKIEGRTGKPVVTGDNATSPRINAEMTVANPTWPTNVNLFLMPEGTAWPASTIMGLDQRYAVRRITNLNASYDAVEEYAIRKAKAMRFDFGEIVDRMYDDAFSVLTVTP